MDPAIATAAVALLAPYLARAGEAFADKAGEAAWMKGEQIYRAIRRKLISEPDPLTESSLQHLAERPDDRRRQDEFAALLAVNGRNDPSFGGEIDRAVRIAINDRSVNQAMTTIYGNVWTGAVTNIGRDQHITYNVRNYRGDSSTELFAEAGAGPRLAMILGMALAIIGVGTFMFFVVGGLSSRTPPNPVPLVPLAFGLFFVGLVFLAAGSLWAAARRRR